MAKDAIERVSTRYGARDLARRFGATVRKGLRPKPGHDFPEHGRVPPTASLPLSPAYGALSSFDPRLESLRGLAALLVCVHHGMTVFAGNANLVVMDALLFAFNSAAAVIFFFVLSGYLLGRALERDGAFVTYLVRRLFRLLPAFVVVVLFTFASERLFRIDPIPSGLKPGFQRMFWPQPTWDALWDNLLLISFKVNGPTWTLFPELMGALMLPFVVAAHVRIVPRWRWALFVAIATLLAISPYHTLLWFYFGYFLANETAALLAERRRLAAITFVVGLIGLEMAGANSEF
jgi:peptidoglycan/LPS O-acetylase OafA/YrhL